MSSCRGLEGEASPRRQSSTNTHHRIMIKTLLSLATVLALASCASTKREECTACCPMKGDKPAAAAPAKPKTSSLTSMAKKASGAEAMEKTAKAAASGDIKGAAASAAAATPQGQAAAAAAKAAEKAKQ